MSRTVVVTGAGGGIGAAVARRLIGDVHLVLTDLRADSLAVVAEDLGDSVDAEYVACDLCDEDAVDRLVRQAAAAGEVVGLVNVAGIGPVQTDDALLILDLNLRATVRVTEGLRGHMPSGSAVVSIGSVASARSPGDVDDLLGDPLGADWSDTWAIRAPNTWAAYAYSKRGLALYTRRRAVDWAKQGVRINIVAPSQTATPLGKASIAENPEIAAFVSRIPMGRMAEPGEVADAVAFLLGDQAGFITGIELFVDGGAGAAGASMTVPT